MLIELLPFVVGAMFAAWIASEDTPMYLKLLELTLITSAYAYIEFDTTTENLWVVANAGNLVGKVIIFAAVAGFVLWIIRILQQPSKA